MKKNYKSVLLSVYCLVGFFISTLYAASIGNPVKPLGHMKFAVSGESNFIFDRKVEADGDSTSGSRINALELSKITQGYTKLICGVSDYANVFVKLGASKINGLDIKFSTGEDVSIESDNNFLYGIGANLIYQISSDELYFIDVDTNLVFFWGISGEYTYFESDADEMYISGVNATNVSGKLKNRQYQLNILAGIEFILDENASLAPYLSGLWNYYTLKTDGIRYNSDILNFDTEAENKFGFGLGLDVNLSKNVSLNAEGRFFGEGHAMSFGGTIKF
jgi:opacity protein-like surface antigen